jgi:DNA processing protein
LRNRIISGLSLGVVVVEASERSGSLITARCALDQGRDVLAVPGPVLSGRNRGAHALLRDGARLVESAEDVLDEIGIRLSAARDGPAEVLDDEPLLRCLPLGDPVDLDAIAALTGLGTDRVLSALTGLELRGVVTRTAGGRFVRAIRKW